MALLSSFIFCETTLKQINDLPEELRLKFYEAVTNYGIYNIEPHFTGLENTIWISMKDIIDTTKAKRERKQKAGKAGGEAKRDRDKNKQPKQDVADGSNPKQDVASCSTAKQDVADGSNPYQALPNVNGNVNVNVNENGNGNGKEESPLSFPPFVEKSAETPEKDYAQIFEEVKSKWKEIIGQETRENLFTVPPAKRERFINTLAVYSLEDIFNAIGNYHIARSDPEAFEIGGRVYGNLIGFLENGVSQFFTDELVESNFRRREHDKKRPK